MLNRLAGKEPEAEVKAEISMEQYRKEREERAAAEQAKKVLTSLSNEKPVGSSEDQVKKEQMREQLGQANEKLMGLFSNAGKNDKDGE